MARIPEPFIEDLLARTDIVELVNQRVPLKKTGRNYSACCPFHQEKTPSFTVAPDKQFYYCFGCGAKGNAVGFLMEYDNLAFPEAIEQLAQRAGMEVPREQGHDAARQKKYRDRLQTLYDLLARAERFYRQQLKGDRDRQRAVDYLKGRGLTGEIAARYGLGFAPPGFDNLMTGLSLDSEGVEKGVECGLLVRREDTGRTYDKFRDRIMFPIRDSRGRTIGFGGRVLGDGKPKYLNSPETPVFHKGEELYGLWEWRQSKEKSGQLFVVEGYMDVIALAQHGISNAVATLGTATTEEHARKLFRQVDEVVFCFDGDNAGRRAAWRALESALPALEDGKQARFLFLPEGEDPDTLVRREGREELLALAARAPGLSRYLFDHLSEGLDLGSVDGRARLARLAMPVLALARGEAYKRLLRKELSELTRLDSADLDALEASQPAARPAPAADIAPPVSEPPPWQEHDVPVGMDDEGAPPPGDQGMPASARNTRLLLQPLLITLIQFPQVASQQPLPQGIEELDEPLLDLIVDLVAIIHDNPEIPAAALLGRLMAMEQGELVSEIMRQSEQITRTADSALREWQDGISALEIRYLERATAAEERASAPDIHRLSELSRRLQEARDRQRSPLAR